MSAQQKPVFAITHMFWRISVELWVLGVSTYESGGKNSSKSQPDPGLTGLLPQWSESRERAFVAAQ